MKIQVTSLNGHDWSDYREKIIHAAREAQSATPASVYTTVLAVVQSNQWPTSIYKRQCLTRWQLCMGQRLQALGEATSRARNSEVPRAATTQPHELQRTVENGKTTVREKNTERVGEMGETPHGKVNEEVAAATGPGMKTTEHHRTDGVSLATPASGTRVDQKVELDLVKPPPPPPSSVASTTPPKWTQPHANESHGMGRVVAGRDDDDDDCRAHERANDPANSADTSMDETAASASTDAATPHHDQAKATRDQGHQSATSTSTPSASHDHPGEDAVTRNTPRPSEDPADATGDDEQRPDAPTEPPDMPEGMRRRGSQERVETRVSGASRGSAWGTDDDGVEMRQVMKSGEA